MKRKIFEIFGLVSMAALLFSSCAKEPVANFVMDKSEAYVGEEVTFTNSSIDAESYEWDFGDNTTSTELNPKHSYTAAGTYKVTLTAKNKKNESSFSQEITIERVNEFVIGDRHYSIKNAKFVRHLDYSSGDTEYYELLFWGDGVNESEGEFYGRGNALVIGLNASALTAGTYNFSDSGIMGTCDDLVTYTDYDFENYNGTERNAKVGRVVVTKEANIYTFDIEFTADEDASKVTGFAKFSYDSTLK